MGLVDLLGALMVCARYVRFLLSSWDVGCPSQRYKAELTFPSLKPVPSSRPFQVSISEKIVGNIFGDLLMHAEMA